MMKKLLMLVAVSAIALNASVARGADAGEATSNEELRQEIIKLMLVNPDTIANSNEKAFEDNINSVRENQNKIKLNAMTRAIALGRRAVALGIKSGEDVDERRKAIETNDDILNMLKDVAALQAQHLQKINEITALRAKLLELNSIESIISGGVATTDKTALSRGGAGGGAGGAGGAGGGGYDPTLGGGADI